MVIPCMLRPPSSDRITPVVQCIYTVTESLCLDAASPSGIDRIRKFKFDHCLPALLCVGAMSLLLVLTVLVAAISVQPTSALCLGPKPANYCSNGYGTWSATNMPPGCSQLYDPNGPWNTPVPPNPAIDPLSPAINDWLYRQDCCRGGLLGDMGWGHHGYAPLHCSLVTDLVISRRLQDLWKHRIKV